MISIAPEGHEDTQSIYNTDLNDFNEQLSRLKRFVNHIPYSGSNRRLDSSCNELTFSQRQEFLNLGNDLLVILFH